MSHNDPVAEWRARWQSGSQYPSQLVSGMGSNYGHKPPRSPWVYAAAAFGGTVAAIIFCVVGLFVLLIAIAASGDGLDTTPDSLTYKNDTDEVVYVYECYERCLTYQWGFLLDAGEEHSYGLEWYYDDPVEWVIVTHDDASYGCIRLLDWKDQTVSVSDATDCPRDIHSPETEIF